MSTSLSLSLRQDVNKFEFEGLDKVLGLLLYIVVGAVVVVVAVVEAATAACCSCGCARHDHARDCKIGNARYDARYVPCSSESSSGQVFANSTSVIHWPS